MKKTACFISLVIGLMCVSAFGQIESQWRGPRRDGIYPEKDLLREWPKDGPELLWTRKHVTEYEVNANTPLYHNGYVYTNSGYGTGGQMFKLSEDGISIEKVWTQRSPDSQMGAVIHVDGYIFGSGHNQRGWHCVDWNSGKVQYSARSVRSKGSLIFADAMLYYYREIGDLLLIRPNSEEFENLGSIKISKGSGEHWAHPVIKSGRLYVRHGEALMVYSIAKK